MPVKTIVFYAVKGGVGKTTEAVNIAAAMGLLEKKVLLIDMDAQAHSTFALGVEEPEMKDSTYAVLMRVTKLKDIIKKTRFKNVWLAPACIDMFAADKELILDVGYREARLKKAIENIKEQYDFILLDPSPYYNMVTINCLYAADAIIIPIQCGVLPFRGLKQLNTILEQQKNDFEHYLPILGYVITMYHRGHKLSEHIREQIQQRFGTLVFKTIIDYSTKVAEAPITRQPIEYYERFGRSCEEHITLAKEVIERAEKI
jgi:chromosome partitioning protein